MIHNTPVVRLPQQLIELHFGEVMRAVGKRFIAYRTRQVQASLTLYGLKVSRLKEKGNSHYG